MALKWILRGMEENIGKFQYLMIPSNIVHDNRLKGNIKIFYAILYSLSFKQGYCFAKNSALAEIMSSVIGKIDSRQIKKYLKILKDYGYIKIYLEKNTKRRIYIQDLVLENLKENKPEELKEIFNYDWLSNEEE